MEFIAINASIVLIIYIIMKALGGRRDRYIKEHIDEAHKAIDVIRGEFHIKGQSLQYIHPRYNHSNAFFSQISIVYKTDNDNYVEVIYTTHSFSINILNIEEINIVKKEKVMSWLQEDPDIYTKYFGAPKTF